MPHTKKTGFENNAHLLYPTSNPMAYRSCHNSCSSLGTRLVNLLPAARQTDASTNGDDGRTWILGREFEYQYLHNNKPIFNKKS